MKFTAKLFVLLLFFALLPCIAAPADAALFTIASSGNGVFTLSGSGLSGVGGIDATIGYDTATLANPRVVQGGLVSGGMFIANTNSPGAVRILVISTKGIAGSGVVATVTFDRQGGSEGKILSLSAGMIDANSSKLPTPQTQVVNPPEPATETPQPTGTSTTPPLADTTATGAGQGYPAPGTITIPGETDEPPKQQPAQEIPQEQPVAEAKDAGTGEPAGEPAAERESPAAQPPAPPEGKNVVYTSVLERFRGFKGVKAPKSLTALFDTAIIPGVRQEPAVALTDGATRVKVFIQTQFTGKAAPNFALKGAKLISLKPEEGAWVVEALPDRKGHDAAITILHNGSRTEIPLAVAPPLDAGSAQAGNLDEAGFIRFLNERGTDKAPRFDLNGDGVRNYIDDYIFTANFIVKRDARTKTPGRMQK